MLWQYVVASLAGPAALGGLVHALTVALREHTKRRKIDRVLDAYRLTLERGHQPDLVELTKALRDPQTQPESSDRDPPATRRRR